MRKPLLLCGLLALLACQKTEITGFQDKPVVEAYLSAEGTPSVKISKLIPFKSDFIFSDMDVNKLEVSITETASGKKYSLQNTGDGVYENSEMMIAAGKSYQLSFPYNGFEVAAKTLVPDKPANMTLSASTIAIAEKGTGIGGAPEMPDPIEIKWTNTDQSYYLVVVKNVESVKTAIDTKEAKAQDFFRNQPTNADHYELNARSFKFYGMHRIILYKIQPEYVLYFQENSTSSISITEIKANIENGFGIFTGINSVSAYLYVGKP